MVDLSAAFGTLNMLHRSSIKECILIYIIMIQASRRLCECLYYRKSLVGSYMYIIGYFVGLIHYSAVCITLFVETIEASSGGGAVNIVNNLNTGENSKQGSIIFIHSKQRNIIFTEFLVIFYMLMQKISIIIINVSCTKVQHKIKKLKENEIQSPKSEIINFFIILY